VGRIFGRGFPLLNPGLQESGFLGGHNVSVITVSLSGVSTLGSIQTIVGFGPYIESDTDRWKHGPITNTVRATAWNRLSDFPDTIQIVGVDFVPVLDNSAQFLISTVVRDRIFLRSRQSISSDKTTEGKP